MNRENNKEIDWRNLAEALCEITPIEDTKILIGIGKFGENAMSNQLNSLSCQISENAEFFQIDVWCRCHKTAKSKSDTMNTVMAAAATATLFESQSEGITNSTDATGSTSAG